MLGHLFESQYCFIHIIIIHRYKSNLIQTPKAFGVGWGGKVGVLLPLWIIKQVSENFDTQVENMILSKIASCCILFCLVTQECPHTLLCAGVSLLVWKINILNQTLLHVTEPSLRTTAGLKWIYQADKAIQYTCNLSTCMFVSDLGLNTKMDLLTWHNSYFVSKWKPLNRGHKLFLAYVLMIA